MEIERDITKPLLESMINGGVEEIRGNVANHVERQYVDALMEDMLNSYSGRVFIGMLLAESRYFENSFIASTLGSANGTADMGKCAFFQGRASIGEYVHGMVYNFNKSEPYVHLCITTYNEWVRNKDKEREALTDNILKKYDGEEI